MYNLRVIVKFIFIKSKHIRNNFNHHHKIMCMRDVTQRLIYMCVCVCVCIRCIVYYMDAIDSGVRNTVQQCCIYWVESIRKFDTPDCKANASGCRC